MVSQVLYYNQAQQYPRIQKDYRDVKGQVKKAEEKSEKLEKAALQTIPSVRRLASLPDDIQNGNAFPAVGVATLAVVNVTQDWEDVREAWHQATDKNYKPKYNYKEVQHPFSFFRGTLLHKFVDPNTTKHPELSKKLLESDTTLTDTKWGEKVLNFLNVKENDRIKTDIQDIGHTKEMPMFVSAPKYIAESFGDLTARAMNRTTTIGMMAFAAIEGFKILQETMHGQDFKEQTKNTLKQTAKSGINLTVSTAGLAYGGAIGLKHCGAIGSLIGMGIGATLGSTASDKLQNLFV